MPPDWYNIEPKPEGTHEVRVYFTRSPSCPAWPFDNYFHVCTMWVRDPITGIVMPVRFKYLPLVRDLYCLN